MRPVQSAQKAQEEVEAILEFGTIDPRIKDFVAGLRRWGVETLMSCEGHLESALPFPWVTISPESLSLCTALLMLHYRQKSNTKPLWVIEPTATPRIRTLEEGYSIEELGELQEKAEDFGKFLLGIPDDYFDAG